MPKYDPDFWRPMPYALRMAYISVLACVWSENIDTLGWKLQ